MELTPEDVLAILELFERSDVEHLSLEVGGAKLVVHKGGAGPATVDGRGSPSGPPATALTAGGDRPVVAEAPANSPLAVERPPTTGGAGVDSGDLTAITAPVLGVFYRAPEPLAPPYVEVGTHVEMGATLGLIEVMKMLNSVTSTVRGEVVEILAKNEEFVEFGQPLIAIRPEPTP